MQYGALKGRDFLKLLDFSPAEIAGLLELAADLKKKKQCGKPHAILAGKQIALIFEKTSTRTRCSFEVAAHDLGMHTTYLEPSGSQIGKKESIADTARVLSRLYDGIEYRGFGQALVEELAQYAAVPVWNGLTNEFHPTQILADFLTIQEHCGPLAGKKLVYLGDARYNMGNSLMVGCAKMGMHFVACAPKAYFPDLSLISTCRAIAEQTGAVLEFMEDPMEAVKGADVLYTDVWVSMGEPAEVWQERIAQLASGVAQGMGGDAEVVITPGYGAVYNDDALYARMEPLAVELLGEDKIVRREMPSLGVESFGYFQKDTPGVYYDLGSGVGTALHTSTFCVDEDCLLPGVAMQCATVLELLKP